MLSHKMLRSLQGFDLCDIISRSFSRWRIGGDVNLSNGEHLTFEGAGLILIGNSVVIIIFFKCTFWNLIGSESTPIQDRSSELYARTSRPSCPGDVKTNSYDFMPFLLLVYPTKFGLHRELKYKLIKLTKDYMRFWLNRVNITTAFREKKPILDREWSCLLF